MAKPPRIRHSKSRRDPVTIDLDASEVERVRDEQPAEAEAQEDAARLEQAAQAEEGVAVNAADEALASDAADASDERVRPNAADESLAAEQAEEVPSEKETDAPAAGRPLEQDSEERRYGRTAAVAPQPARPTGMSAALAGGLIGAVLALIGAGALQWAGMLPPPRDDAGVVDAASLDVLRAEIAALRQEIAAGETAGSDGALTQALSESGSRIDALAAEIEQLQSGLEELRTAGQQGGGADPAEVQALASRLAQLESAVSAEDEGAAIEAVTQSLASLQAAQQQATEAVAANDERLAALEQQLSSVTQRVEQQAEEPRMALAVAATALKSAIDRGTPFMAELETYAAIAPDAPEIAALRDLAASGVPTRAEIEQVIPDAAARMIEAASPADPNAGFFDRLATSARSLVQVRPVGQVDGDSVEAKIARMEVALREGDYAQAIGEFETLPEPVRAAGSEFIEKVRARLAADQLVAKALSGAVEGSVSQ
jgi:hypothetical protein